MNWKRFFAVLNIAIGYACLLWKFAYGVDESCIRQEFDGISYALYVFEGNPVWTDEEKLDIIREHNKELLNVKFSTNAAAKTISDADFTPCSSTRISDISLLKTVFKIPLRRNAWFVRIITKEDAINLLNNGSAPVKQKYNTTDDARKKE